MKPSQKRLAILAAALALFLVASAVLYMVGMALLEEAPRGFWRSLLWAAETLSTTGYGSDNNWNHPLMVIFVVVLQFAGVTLVFLVFPVYLLPALEERFQRRLPRSATRFSRGIAIFRYGTGVAGLVEEIERTGHSAIIIESNEDRARRLMENGKIVVFGTVEDGVLSRIDLDALEGVVVNDNDGENAATTLALRDAGFSGDIFALVEEPRNRRALSLAGATGVFTPRHILAAALAASASDRISPRVLGAQALGQQLEVREMRVGAGSELAGRTLRDADVGKRTGVTVIGQWLQGKLVTPVDSDALLEADSILVVAGSSDHVHAFSDTCQAERPDLDRPFVVAGCGEVGSKVVELLTSAEEKVVTVDLREKPGVDVVGDITDPRVLESASVQNAQAIILAVGVDSATLLATLVARDYAPRVPIIARVNEAANVERIHRAGADFALSISQVSGQLLATRLFGRESISIDPALRVLKTAPAGFVGRHPVDLGIRERTGASVVAVERGEQIVVHFDADFSFEADDVVYVCGSCAATQRFVEIFPDRKA